MDSLLELDVMMIPRGLPNLAPLAIQIGEIRSAESRIKEIADVTPHKAPELMACFNQAYSELTRIISGVEYEYELSLKHAREVKAVIILDKVPEILRQKGLNSSKNPGGSEDMRSAILDLDPDYKSAQERILAIKAYLTLLEGKKKSIDMAYTAVKKILGGDQGSYRSIGNSVTDKNNVWKR
jgi:hypothetical protein